MPADAIDCRRRLTVGAVRIPVAASGPGWLVVEKPCSMSIHNDPGDDLCSMVQAGLRAGELPEAGRGAAVVHAVHRLDRDTSGLVLLAADAHTLAFFGEQFASGSVHKGYLALVHGHPAAPVEPTDRGAWTWPLTAAAAGRGNPKGWGKRLACATRWRILDHSRHYSLIVCRPLTGRTHQIRRHAKLAGHPVVGDRRYGSPRALDYLERHGHFNRLALHAHTLTLNLPGDARTTTFRSAGLPAAIRRLFEADRSP